MSAPTKSADTGLLDQQLALGAYLESLLCVPAAPEPPAGESEPMAPTEHGDRPAPETVADAGGGPEREHRDWARGRFPCLRFKVGGITLAVPLARLNGVLEWPAESIRPMPGHSPAFLGVLAHQGRQVKVIDTRYHVIPSDRRDREPAGERRPRRIVLIGDGQWGLACDEVEEVMELAPEEVKWRSASGKRPWLAGTVIAHMCALIDADAFARLLREGEEG